MASGTLTAGSATVPWVVWAEDTGSGKHRIFISRLVNGDHFELFNGGQSLSPADRDATHPDITFFGNVPYVSWIEAHGDRNRGFVGHFENNVFVLDTPGEIVLAPRFHRASLIDARVPVSSSCTADPFTNDGQACAPAAVNSAFDLFTINDHPQRLFGQAVIGGPNCVLFPHCRLGIVGHGDDELIEGNLAHSNSVGILVQRIVGTKRVHGKRVLALRRSRGITRRRELARHAECERVRAQVVDSLADAAKTHVTHLDYVSDSSRRGFSRRNVQ